MSERCPYCNEEMEFGYIQCRDGVWWAKKKRQVAAFPSLNKESVHLSQSETGPYAGHTAEAYLCRTCKKVVIDYREE